MRITDHETTTEWAARPVAGPLRALMTAYQLWGSRNECAADELSGMYRISTAALLEAMRHLATDGLVRIDHERGTLSLTESGARALALLPPAIDS